MFHLEIEIVLLVWGWYRNSLPRYVNRGIYLTLAPLLCGLALLTPQYDLKLTQSPDLQTSTTGALPSLYQQKGLGLYEGAVVSSRTFNVPCPRDPLLLPRNVGRGLQQLRGNKLAYLAAQESHARGHG